MTTILVTRIDLSLMHNISEEYSVETTNDRGLFSKSWKMKVLRRVFSDIRKLSSRYSIEARCTHGSMAYEEVPNQGLNDLKQKLCFADG